MQMTTIAEQVEFDRLLAHLEDVTESLEQLYQNIDDYDRSQAAAKIATNAGMIRGVVTCLVELKG
jgi:hypothetical protein